MSKLVAVLVDGDNVSGRLAARIQHLAAHYGTASVSRVYTDAQRGSEWHDAAGYRLIHAGIGKNAADILLALDAMELLLTQQMRSFVIVSSDGDFRHLVTRLREHGASVIGLGEKKAPPAYRACCSEFKEISLADAGDPQTPGELDLQIRAMVAQHSKQGAGMRITELSPKMYQAHGVKISKYQERSWRAYLAARPSLYELEPRGPNAMVRFRPEGFPGWT
ncbi:NYN domain-containing protein [Salipiger sp. H15]|uniref:NYN domain-containing protein n=1 Tax=Alloyangia sp. H15 TaxID=3029062 RepID=A0AAU8AL42_9RHOB